MQSAKLVAISIVKDMMSQPRVPLSQRSRDYVNAVVSMGTQYTTREKVLCFHQLHGYGVDLV